MMKIYFSIFLIIYKGYVLSVNGQNCFEYTWIAPIFAENSDKYNCSSIKNNPCISPIIYTEKPPDTNELWETKQRLCSIISGNVCIKYTFYFNNNIVNTSLFCGRAIEDNIIPITSGCYEQQINGYVLEMCACEARQGKPCNTSVTIKYSIILINTMLLLIFIRLL
ncbi:uncharacterized protein LOC105736393 [Apis florea]|uniref:uncharacterized protein LOC105736393 n=1 Tax=Apis florea TaxID=7463 RepID=UPI000629C3A0|nr:uncharacterized protein LOC105736393 [Apis florea]